MNQQNFVKEYGPWAIVTGASAGIGEEYAKQLASYGLNLVLVARRKEKLTQLADKLQRQHGVQVRIASADLSQLNFMDNILQATTDIEIGLLINNAGIYFLGDFLDFPVDRQDAMLNVNVRAPMVLTHMFGQIMRERGRGGIIIVSSTVSGSGAPLNANYAATETYDLVFGEGLHYELKASGVDVQVLVPGGTRTEGAKKMLKDAPSYMNMMMMDSTPVVTTSLKSLGRKCIVIPGMMNNMMSFMAVRLMPRTMAVRMWRFMMKSMMGKSVNTSSTVKAA